MKESKSLKLKSAVKEQSDRSAWRIDFPRFVFALLITASPSIVYANTDRYAHDRRMLAGYGIGLVIMSIFACYCLIRVRVMLSKNKKCKAIMAELRKIDDKWDIEEIDKRIEYVFLNVQKTWSARDQRIAKEVLTNRFHHEFCRTISGLISNSVQRDLETVYLSYAEVVKVEEYQDKSKDCFWAYIKASMSDYRSGSGQGQLFFGDKSKIDVNLCELWKFCCVGDSWLLDEIIEDVSIRKIAELSSYSESLSGSRA